MPQISIYELLLSDVYCALLWNAIRDDKLPIKWPSMQLQGIDLSKTSSDLSFKRRALLTVVRLI